MYNPSGKGYLHTRLSMASIEMNRNVGHVQSHNRGARVSGMEVFFACVSIQSITVRLWGGNSFEWEFPCS